MENSIESKQPLLSIIIPVYNNTQCELKRCFNSILNQSVDGYEIIVVDDGSSMACASFLDVFALKNDKFRVYHQKNAGVSVARNNGMKFSKGRYITFVDADDLVTGNFLEDAYGLLEKIGEDNVDIIYGCIGYVKKPTKSYFDKLDVFKPIQLNYELKQLLYKHMIHGREAFFKRGDFYVGRGPVAKIVKRSAAIKNPFNELLTCGEDAIWNLDFLSKDLKSFFIKKLWYIYVENPYSNVHRFTDDKVRSYAQYLTCLWNYITNDKLKICFLYKTVEAIMEIERSYYLFNVDRLNRKPDIHSLIQETPWNLAFKWKYAIHLDLKDLIKFMLIRFRLGNILLPLIIRLKYKCSAK